MSDLKLAKSIKKALKEKLSLKKLKDALKRKYFGIFKKGNTLVQLQSPLPR